MRPVKKVDDLQKKMRRCHGPDYKPSAEESTGKHLAKLASLPSAKPCQLR